MKKILGRLLICFVLCAAVWSILLIRDRTTLRRELIRLHVVANSDSPEDQRLKRSVRDAVLESLQDDLARATDKDAALAYLQENMPKLQRIVNTVLKKAGVEGDAVITLCREAFPVRHYDTFSLPSGVYDTLRIIIGQGNGHNWWCVAFPTLCLPATSEEFDQQAVSAGFSSSLSHTLSGRESYRLRFYLLDALGKLETRLWDHNI